MNYLKETKNAYKNREKAKEYHEQYTKGFKWARFTMWRQRVILKRLLTECNFTEHDKILDIPCGTGFIGKLLCKTAATITASDISAEMIKRASDEYKGDNFTGFIECDITKTDFKNESFDCVIVLAFMHRLPTKIRLNTWREVVRISKKYIIVNYGFDSYAQRIKKWILKLLTHNYIPAPTSLPIKDIINEVNSFGLVIKKITYVAYFFSGKVVIFLEKN